MYVACDSDDLDTHFSSLSSATRKNGFNFKLVLLLRAAEDEINCPFWSLTSSRLEIRSIRGAIWTLEKSTTPDRFSFHPFISVLNQEFFRLRNNNNDFLPRWSTCPAFPRIDIRVRSVSWHAQRRRKNIFPQGQQRFFFRSRFIEWASQERTGVKKWSGWWSLTN